MKIEDFKEDLGPQIPDIAESPCDVFLCIFPDYLVHYLVYQTNLYACQKVGGGEILGTDESEIKRFLDANLMMGITKKPSLENNWRSSEQLRDPYISSLLSLKGFQWLLSNLHSNDNLQMPRYGSPSFDKLFKIRPYLNFLSNIFLQCYKPTRYISVDEIMVKFKGRSTLKQYMPMTPIKRGFKYD